MSNRWRSSISRSKASTPVDVVVSGWGDQGDGEILVGSKRLFLPGVMPGEQLTILPDKTAPKLLKIIANSTDRRKSPCRYASECGGCQLQHVEPRAQLDFKRSRLEKFLSGLSTAQELPTIELIGHDDGGYRRRARLAISYRGGKMRIGFRQAKSNRIVDIEQCYNLSRPLNNVVRALRPLLGEQHAVSHIELLELEQVVGVYMRVTAKLSDEFMAGLAALPGISVKISDGENWLVNTPWLISTHGVEVAYHPGDFLQANRQVNDDMVARVINWLEIRADDRIADFFSGLGNFSVPMAVKGGSIIGFEGSDAMVDRARNAIPDELDTNLQYQCADLFSTEIKLGDFNKVLLDPPRAGAEALCQQLAKSKSVQRIVYVSCDTSTLARDLRFLTEGGFKMTKLALADMFPNTVHSETLVLLERNATMG